MSDDDRAQEAELRDWEQINRSRPEPKRYAPGDTGYGPEFCQEKHCGEEMPEVRRAWGFTRCMPCAQRLEQQGR